MNGVEGAQHTVWPVSERPYAGIMNNECWEIKTQKHLRNSQNYVGWLLLRLMATGSKPANKVHMRATEESLAGSYDGAYCDNDQVYEIRSLQKRREHRSAPLNHDASYSALR
jgi:hypothetical protein